MASPRHRSNRCRGELEADGPEGNMLEIQVWS
jgi:hypothetical protein